MLNCKIVERDVQVLQLKPVSFDVINGTTLNGAEKTPYFLLGECKYSINVAFPLQSHQLVSAQLTLVSSFLIAKEKQQRPFQTMMHIKAWLSSHLKVTSC